MRLDDALLRRLPKVLLHEHLDGGLRPGTVIELAAEAGYEGLPTYGPFDRILITAAAPDVPPKLIAQLKPGGMMVIPVGSGDFQTMKRLIKQADGSIKEESFDLFSFVPMLGGKNE